MPLLAEGWRRRVIQGSLAVLLAAQLPVAMSGAVPKHGKKVWTDEYDHHFRKYSKHYFGPNFRWQWFKAQGIAESGLRPNAKSHVGAKGIMQILPSTYEDIKDRNPHFVHLDEPRWNIAAGIFYDRYLYLRWKERAAARERISFAFASYNAGLGRVNKAYRRAKKKVGTEAQNWPKVAPHAPKETQNYVQRIHKFMKTIR